MTGADEVRYDARDTIDRLRARALGPKRSLALREFALGIEGLERSPEAPRCARCRSASSACSHSRANPSTSAQPRERDWPPCRLAHAWHTQPISHRVLAQPCASWPLPSLLVMMGSGVRESPRRLC
ncbi:MAG TPA: hypothetical protein VGO31_10155 [Microbacteriaceae bacterium]|nr:hypothetical protein [Microbacteriaceae bacterium]